MWEYEDSFFAVVHKINVSELTGGDNFVVSFTVGSRNLQALVT